MPKFLFLPDSFKGTLSSLEICQLLTASAARCFPQAQIKAVPAADGGEGSCECFLQAEGGERIFAKASGPFNERIKASYALLNNGNTAVIEMAACAGLPLAEGRLNPLNATTFGVGELMQSALSKGVKRIILALGGSATNDAGCGAAAALGVKFYNAQGQSFVPCGGSLKDIAKISMDDLDPRLAKVEITAMCDIDNPLYGPKGAACIFGPQKGADPEMVQKLDAGLRQFAAVCRQDLGLDCATIPGAGAAGGMGAGVVAFFKARLQSGIDTVLDEVDFDRLCQEADFIFTGEGLLDGQSLQGKVVMGIARRSLKVCGCPKVIAIVGGCKDSEIAPAYEQGLCSVFTINRLPQDYALARQYSAENFKAAADNIFALLKAAGIR